MQAKKSNKTREMVKHQQILKKQANNNKIDKEENSSLQRDWTITSLVFKTVGT